jgi:hypothetical protein
MPCSMSQTVWDAREILYLSQISHFNDSPHSILNSNCAFEDQISTAICLVISTVQERVGRCYTSDSSEWAALVR